MKYLHTFTQNFNRLLLPTLLISILFIPWLGEALFYSKGEPREAIVAVSIIDSGDWILPVSYGEDIPYKPPFMAWIIAIFAMIFNGGCVNEFISRLPSALAGIALLVATWKLVTARRSAMDGWRVMLILATMFEFFRATVACRVDMLLTCCMVGGIYALYTSQKKPIRIVWAILLFSGATLTKGPVGTLLPCLAIGLYYLSIGRNFFKTFFSLLGIALASFILPAIWYWLAYKAGGSEFARLAWEENIGRLTGTMSYDSHINPWYYNFISMLAGALPWTIPVLVSIIVTKLKPNLGKDDLGRLSLIVGITIFVFYCFPASKRSVYLLPCYPFLTIGVCSILTNKHSFPVLKIWSRILAVICILVPIIFTALLMIPIKGLTLENPGVFGMIMVYIPLLAGGWWLFTRTKNSDGLAGSIGLTFILVLSYNAAYMPAAVNPKSDFHAVAKIEETTGTDTPIYTFIQEDSLLRYYSVNFYMNDRLRRITNMDNISAEKWILSSDTTNSFNPVLIKNKSADTRQPIYLYKKKIVNADIARE